VIEVVADEGHTPTYLHELEDRKGFERREVTL